MKKGENMNKIETYVAQCKEQFLGTKDHTWFMMALSYILCAHDHNIIPDSEYWKIYDEISIWGKDESNCEIDEL